MPIKKIRKNINMAANNKYPIITSTPLYLDAIIILNAKGIKINPKNERLRPNGAIKKPPLGIPLNIKAKRMKIMKIKAGSK
ncbi:MAG: hypothetical protein JSV09_12000 [Thermoplasmata archaeon]|nr:MAG: hypothetical protein JSV09_12000 [Thermoplasmata archaeon]